MRLCFAPAALSVAVSLAGCSWLTTPEPVVDPQLVISDGSPCGDACAKVVNCLRPEQHEEAMTQCQTDCAAQGENSQLTCLEQATCDNLEACFGTDEQTLCAQVRGRYSACGADSVVGDGFDCAGLEVQHLNCLKDAACDQMTACLEGSEHAACAAMCSKMEQCGALQDEGVSLCVAQCVAHDQTHQRTCVAASACEQIDACWTQPRVCTQACGRLVGCETMAASERADCQARCLAPWPEALTTCLMSSACGDLGACGALP